MPSTIHPTHVLQDEEQRTAIRKRLVRAHGQLGAIIRMFDEGRGCDEIVLQVAASKKALSNAAFALLSASLLECMASDAGDRTDMVAVLQKLYLSLA